MNLKSFAVKKCITLFAFALLSAVSVFAQSDIMPSGMTSLMENIIGIFTGPFVQGILIICLCGCAVAYGFNKDNEKMKRNIIAIAVAIAILVAASNIVEAVWNAAQ
jgi:type IV secretory pathway VirB2 component (pilin)